MAERIYIVRNDHGARLVKANLRQQSMIMALMGPSCGLNTPKVMQAVGSFWTFSLVAKS